MVFSSFSQSIIFIKLFLQDTFNHSCHRSDFSSAYYFGLSKPDARVYVTIITSRGFCSNRIFSEVRTTLLFKKPPHNGDCDIYKVHQHLNIQCYAGTFRTAIACILSFHPSTGRRNQNDSISGPNYLSLYSTISLIDFRCHVYALGFGMRHQFALSFQQFFF